MKFVKRKLDDMFSPRDYWDLDGFTATVINDNDVVSVIIKRKQNNYTEKILEILQQDQDYLYITKGSGIDAVFIECPKDTLNDVLIKIEDICKTLDLKEQ